MHVHNAQYAPVLGSHAGLPEADYVVITPYLLPPATRKKVNIGDGFILDSAIRLIGARPKALLSSRAPLTEADIEFVNASKCVLAIGANTLKDDFELVPAFSSATLERLRVPVILMGVGHFGVEDVTRGLNPASIKLFRALLERFPFMSVRCDASRRYVLAAMPDRADSILMTSCPVVHPVDGIDRGFVRKEIYDQVVVTITDRANIQAQLPLLPAAKALFPARRRILALHQDFENQGLWKFAQDQGFEVFRDSEFAPFIALYTATDMHLGNRVHGHLKCLSLGIRSFCTPFDLRQVYFARSLDYPLISKIPSPDFADYDFARVVARRAIARQTMDKFVAAVRAIL